MKDKASPRVLLRDAGYQDAAGAAQLACDAASYDPGEARSVIAQESVHVECDPADGRTLRRIALPTVLLLGLSLRLLDLGQPFIGDKSWNDAHYSVIARNFERYGWLTQHTIWGPEYTNSPLVPWLIGASRHLFGPAEWAARLPLLIFGALALTLLYLLADALYGRRVGLVATFIAAMAPGLAFYGSTIVLDGPMMTSGLLAVLALVYFRRGKGTAWLVVSLMAFSLSLAFKYTAILLVPCLAWIWLMERPASGSAATGVRNAVGLLGFLVLSAIPSTTWLLWSASESGPGLQNYLNRFDEFTAQKSVRVLINEWDVLQRQIGRLPWFAFLLSLPFALSAPRKWPEVFRRYAVAILLTVPWFLQLAYPWSWAQNEYYHYQLLWGGSILLAALFTYVVDSARDRLQLPAATWSRLVAVLLGLCFLSNALDYWRDFHGSYYPWPTVADARTFAGARLVAELNEMREPVLCDLLQTAYYAGADPGYVKYWWWRGADDPAGHTFVERLEARQPRYVAFTYEPSYEISVWLLNNDYSLIAPGTWVRVDNAESTP